MDELYDNCMEREIRKKVRQNLDINTSLSDVKVLETIREIICDKGKDISIGIEKRKILERRIFNSLRRLDILQEFLEDEDITEIMINGSKHIFIEKNGELIETNQTFYSKEVLEDIIQKIAGSQNKIINETNPIIDTRLSDGSRVNIVLEPISIYGSTITIRKFPKAPMTLDKLLEFNTISMEIYDFLEKIVKAKYNIFISGGTSSGKTSFLNALIGKIPPEERVICIEDSAELSIKDIKNIVRLESRDKNIEGKNEITIRDLVKTSLRMRPDRLVVGECRGAETFEMLQAMNTGHDGGMSTGHGNSPKDMIGRLISMSLMAENLPLSVIKHQISSGIEIMIHLERLKNGKRRLIEISEIDGIENEEIKMHKIFSYKGEDKKWEKVGNIVHKDKLTKIEE